MTNNAELFTDGCQQAIFQAYVEELIETAAAVGWNSCRWSLLEACEDIEEKAYGNLEKQGITEHQEGFYRAEKWTGKRLRRAFGGIEARHDENFVKAVDGMKASFQVRKT